jgi:hypothetical protein
MASPKLLSTLDVAHFLTNGFLRFDAVVPAEINDAALAEMADLKPFGAYKTNDPLRPQSGTPLSACYPADSALRQMLETPEIAGAILSLAGPDPLYDHHAIHFLPAGSTYQQHLHCDAAIDSNDPAFDIQVFYFPHDVAEGAGGTRFVPGSHLRNIHKNSVARYQHIAGEKFFSGEAGTVLIFHSGMWHAGRANPSEVDRRMFKIRLNPSEPQVRHWDTSNYDDVVHGDWDHIFATIAPGQSVAQELRQPHAWSFDGEYRLEVMERVRIFRYMAGDTNFDVDWYHTRIDRHRANAEQAGR